MTNKVLKTLLLFGFWCNFSLVKCSLFARIDMELGMISHKHISFLELEKSSLENKNSLSEEIQTLYECECVKPNLTSRSFMFETPELAGKINRTKILIEDIAESASDLAEGVYQKIPDMLPSFSSLYENGKNMMAGYPFEVVSN